MSEVITVQDLETLKKHEIFEAEVLTGKVGGLAVGADIDYATNAATGQVQKTLPAILRDLGFEPASFDFTTGGTLGVSDRNRAVLWPLADGGDGDWYNWEGVLPKVVPAASTPYTTGGVVDGAWRPVGDITLRGDLATPSGSSIVGFQQAGAGSVPCTSQDKMRESVSVKDFGAKGDGVTDDTVAFQNAINSFAFAGKLYVPAGTYLISNTLLCDDKFIAFIGDGTAATFIKYSPPVVLVDGTLFHLKHTVDNRRAFTFSKLSLTTDVPLAGTAIRIEAKLTAAGNQVNGGDDTLYMDQVRIIQTGGGYWRTFLRSLHNGGMHLSQTSFNNSITEAQTDTNVIGIYVESTDSRVSSIRTLTVTDFYMLRTSIALYIKTTGSKQAESFYFSQGEIVGCSTAAIKVDGQAGAGYMAGVHFDVIQHIADCTNGQFLLWRFTGCDFRRANGPNGPHFTISTGEMLDFTGCMFSGSSLTASDPLNKVFNVTGAFRRWSVTGCSFRNLHSVFGPTPGSTAKMSGNTYNFVTTVIQGDPGDTSNGFQDAVVSKAVVISLDATGNQTVTVSVPPGYFEPTYPWPVAMLQPAQGTGADNLYIRYDFPTSNSSTCTFVIKGNTTARSVRFSFIAMCTSSMDVQS